MKALATILCTLILSCAHSFAAEYPVAKGASVLCGGFIGTQELKEPQPTTAVTLDYFVRNNLMIGFGVYNDAFRGHLDLSPVGFGPEIGFALGSAHSPIFPYVKVGCSYLQRNQGYSVDTGAAAGIIVHVHGHLGITPEVSFHYQHDKQIIRGFTTPDYQYYPGHSTVWGLRLFRIGLSVSGLLY